MEVLEEILEFVENEDGDVQIKMIKGEYKGLVIRYGDVMFFPGEESNDNIQFSYDIIENPTKVKEDEEEIITKIEELKSEMDLERTDNG